MKAIDELEWEKNKALPHLAERGYTNVQFEKVELAFPLVRRVKAEKHGVNYAGYIWDGGEFKKRNGMRSCYETPNPR